MRPTLLVVVFAVIESRRHRHRHWPSHHLVLCLDLFWIPIRRRRSSCCSALLASWSLLGLGHPFVLSWSPSLFGRLWLVLFWCVGVKSGQVRDGVDGVL